MKTRRPMGGRRVDVTPVAARGLEGQDARGGAGAMGPQSMNAVGPQDVHARSMSRRSLGSGGGRGVAAAPSETLRGRPSARVGGKHVRVFDRTIETSSSWMVRYETETHRWPRIFIGPP